ncbi:unnamed protein product [Chrysoparadoxa australica]
MGELMCRGKGLVTVLEPKSPTAPRALRRTKETSRNGERKVVAQVAAPSQPPISLQTHLLKCRPLACKLYCVGLLRQIQELSSKARLADDAVVTGKVQVVVDEEEDCDRLASQEQGDIQLYAADVMAVRKSHFHDREVVSLMEELWGVEGLQTTNDKMPSCRIIEAEAFSLLMTKLSRLLTRPPVKAKAVARLCKKDWEKDSKGLGYISKLMFFESIFELVDLWTVSTDVTEYRTFLRGVLDGITHVDPDLPGVRRFLDDDKIFFTVGVGTTQGKKLGITKRKFTPSKRVFDLSHLRKIIADIYENRRKQIFKLDSSQPSLSSVMQFDQQTTQGFLLWYGFQEWGSSVEG